MLYNNPGFGKYFENVSWLFVENALRMLAGVLVSIYVARYLGPQNFGLLSYVVSFSAMFSAIADLGLEGIIVRGLVNAPEKSNSILGTGLWLRLGGAFAAILAITIVALCVKIDWKTMAYILIVSSALLFQSLQTIDYYFQSQVKAKYVSMCKIFQLGVSSVVKLALIAVGADLFWFVLMTLIDWMLLSVALMFAYRTNVRRSYPFDFDAPTAKEMLKDSWPLILSGVTVMVYLRLDHLMIRQIMGEAALGQYAAAVKLAEIWYFIPAVIASSVFPAIINARKIDRVLYLGRMKQLYSLMVWMAICIAVPVSIFSKDIILILYGDKYSQAAEVLQIYIWGGCFVFLSSAFGKYLITENLTAKNFYRVLFGALVSAPLNYLFINVYGIKGAAVAYLLALTAANYVYDIFDRDLRGHLPLKTRAFFYPLSILRGNV